VYTSIVDECGITVHYNLTSSHGNPPTSVVDKGDRAKEIEVDSMGIKGGFVRNTTKVSVVGKDTEGGRERLSNTT
jgi:hypothetical protein